MLSFPGAFIKEKKNQKNHTLQVRIPLMYCAACEKRVLSAASCHFPASMTVEAALVLPLFLFSMVILMMPMRIMNEGRKVQMALETVCEEVSQYTYLLSSLEDKKKAELNGDDEISGELSGSLTKAGVILYADKKVRKLADTGKTGHFSFLNTEFLEDGETINLVLDYEIALPFPVFQLKSVPMTARSCRRAWIGSDGKTTGEGSDQNSGDRLVYIGKASTRYHCNKTCHYLYNDISAVPASEVHSMRNAEGKKYRACSRCTGASGMGDTVYVMPSGECYHSSRNCSAIVAYVRAVPLSEVEYLGACSYCGG